MSTWQSVILKSGDVVKLPKNTKVTVQLVHTVPTKLHLHAFYRTKEGREGHIYHKNEGNLYLPPCIEWNEEEGKEQLAVKTLTHVETVLIAVQLNKGFLGLLTGGDNFAKYESQLLIHTDSPHEIEIPLDTQKKGLWYAVAKIVNHESTQIERIDKVEKFQPRLTNF